MIPPILPQLEQFVKNLQENNTIPNEEQTETLVKLSKNLLQSFHDLKNPACIKLFGSALTLMEKSDMEKSESEKVKAIATRWKELVSPTGLYAHVQPLEGLGDIRVIIPFNVMDGENSPFFQQLQWKLKNESIDKGNKLIIKDVNAELLNQALQDPDNKTGFINEQNVEDVLTIATMFDLPLLEVV